MCLQSLLLNGTMFLETLNFLKLVYERYKWDLIYKKKTTIFKNNDFFLDDQEQTFFSNRNQLTSNKIDWIIDLRERFISKKNFIVYGKENEKCTKKIWEIFFLMESNDDFSYENIYRCLSLAERRALGIHWDSNDNTLQ